MLVVDEEAVGQRLDNFLLHHLKGVPKTHVYRIIRSGEVRVNKGRARADTRLEAGDMVRLPPLRLSERAADKAQAMRNHAAAEGGFVPAREFAVLFEDDSFLALDKPAGVAVHGGSGVGFGVIEQLRMARPQARFLELVHRLDRETSGILLVAKKRSALKNLQEQFRARQTGKTYLALVSGRWPEQRKVLDRPLQKTLVAGAGGQEERRVKVLAKGDPDGLSALTLVKVRCVSAEGPQPFEGAFSLLEVTIKTGRTHQIRVHLAAEGMPIAGDDKYGDFALNRTLARAAGAHGLRRMFLHAWRLQCQHPVTGVEMALQAELPGDLAEFLRQVCPGA